MKIEKITSVLTTITLILIVLLGVATLFNTEILSWIGGLTVGYTFLMIALVSINKYKKK